MEVVDMHVPKKNRRYHFVNRLRDNIKFDNNNFLMNLEDDFWKHFIWLRENYPALEMGLREEFLG
jgi:hypothetical protein